MAGVEANCEARSVRGWELLVLPRTLLFKPLRGGIVPRKKLEERVRQFQEGDWLSPHWESLPTLDTRLPVPRRELSLEIRQTEPRDPFVLDPVEFLRCLKKVRRGATTGPSGMISDHLFRFSRANRNCSFKFALFPLWGMCQKRSSMQSVWGG